MFLNLWGICEVNFYLKPSKRYIPTTIYCAVLHSSRYYNATKLFFWTDQCSSSKWRNFFIRTIFVKVLVIVINLHVVTIAVTINKSKMIEHMYVYKRRQVVGRIKTVRKFSHYYILLLLLGLPGPFNSPYATIIFIIDDDNNSP